MSNFTVAIIGRPNVGKSFLFNQLAGKRKAIVDETQGVTRDRIITKVTFKKKEFTLIDTGGFDFSGKDTISKKVLAQTTQAMHEANLLIYVCDVTDGVLPLDIEISNLLRKFQKEVILAVNKVDNKKLLDYVGEFYQLGLSDPLPISATCGVGIKQLLNDIIEYASSKKITKEQDLVKITICGRPNVGKSSFLNYLLGEERIIVSEIPGTTRDSVDIFFKKDDQNFLLVDTAGIVHKKKIKDNVSFYSKVRTIESIRKSDVCIVLTDAKEGLFSDDKKIIKTVIDEGKCCIIAVNKWDLIEDILSNQYQAYLVDKFSLLSNYPIINTSAKTGLNIVGILDIAQEVHKNSLTKVTKEELSEFVKQDSTNLINRLNSKRVKFFQDQVAPPTFNVVLNKSKPIKKEILRYIENRLREKFDFFGTPIRIGLKRKSK